MDAIAALDGRRIADDCGAFGVPADGVAAPENGERAEAFETSGGRAKACDCGMRPSIG